MMAKFAFNVVAALGTAESELAPYPQGSATVPKGYYRRFYLVVIANTADAAATVTIRLYKGDTAEATVTVPVGPRSTVVLSGEGGLPVLTVPPERTLKASASATGVYVLMAGYDE